MKIKDACLFLLIPLACCVSCFSQKIISKKPPDNPTTYVFKIKIKDAALFLEQGCTTFGGKNMFVDDIFYHNTWRRYPWSDEAKLALSGQGHDYDAWMNVIVDSSNIYADKKGKPLEYTMECVAHFIMIDSSTTQCQIKVLNAMVHVRNQLLPSPPHFVNNPIYKKVMPTTVEEYKILQCLGKELGVIAEMPPLKL